MTTSSVQPALAWRDAARRRLAADEFDVVVVGGGINGAGISRDAALRGLRVALIERDDFAGGTSSRSSRLVHGGVRYLEHGFLHLVFEASRERRILLRIAPHLVHPLRFTWPVYRGARMPRWKLSAGLWLYDLLAMFRNVARHRGLGSRDVLALEPRLASDGLTGGAVYYDAATSDVRLTIANIIDAARAGAIVLNHAEVGGLVLANDQVAGVTVRDRLSGDLLTVRSKTVVNATGPWTDSIRRLESPLSTPAVLGTKGVHVAVPADRVGNNAAVTMLSPVDGRVMFVLPGGAQTIIGTTDTPTNEPPERVRATRADVDYLLESANAYFPAARLGRADVVSAWAGIRPLIASGNRGDPAAASREHAITVGPRGIIAVTGGKLTTYRSMSAEVVDAVQRRLGRPPSPSPTATRILPGGEPSSRDATHSEPVAPGVTLTRGDVDDAVGHEFACSISDVLVRRTSLAFATRDHGLAVAPRVAALLAPAFGWSAADAAHAVDDYRADVERLFTIDP